MLHILQAALRSNEHGNALADVLDVIDAQVTGRREQQSRVPGSLGSEHVEKVDRDCQFRNPVASTLLTGCHGNGAPMLQLSLSLSFIQAYDAALGGHRDDTRDAELGG